MKDNEAKISVMLTCAYGEIEDYNNYDLFDILGSNLLDYKLTKIKCQLKSNTSIYGIQLTYKNINDGKETTLIDIKSDEKDLIEQEMDLKDEEIKDLRVWLNENICLIGFEVTTNKNRIQKFGYGNDEELRVIKDFKNMDKIIVGFGFYANINEKKGITAIYAYFIDKHAYISYIFDGLLTLRTKVKQTIFKEKIKKKLTKMNEKNNILFKICQLPDNQFFNIIKYSYS